MPKPLLAVANGEVNVMLFSLEDNGEESVTLPLNRPQVEAGGEGSAKRHLRLHLVEDYGEGNEMRHLEVVNWMGSELLWLMSANAIN